MNSKLFFSVLISVALVSLLLSLPFLFLLYFHRKGLRRLRDDMDNLYVSEYRFGKPIEEQRRQCRYLVKFEYQKEPRELLTGWYRQSHSLKGKTMSVGYIEKRDIVVVLNEL